MLKKIFILSLCFMAISLFADDKVQNQIENLLKQQDISTSQKRSLKSYDYGSFPQGLEKITTWQYQGAFVEQIILQQSNDVTVTVYSCKEYQKYWYRLQGSILGVDLWYGHYSYGNRYHDSSYFLERFSINHRLQRPILKPKGLDLKLQYKTLSDGNIVTKYSHGSVFPGYNVFSYYCDKSNRYWVELVDKQSTASNWYGPYPFSYPIPVVKLRTVVTLDKSQYGQGESPHVTIWVHNDTSRAVRLNFSSGMRGDYSIDGQYRWSSNMMFTQMLGREFIPAYGKKQLFNKPHTFSQYPLNAGSHSIVGIIKTMNHGELRSEAVSFSVRRAVHNPTRVWMNKAIAFMGRKKYNPARNLLLKVIGAEPTNAIAHYNLTCIEALTYNEDLALDYFKRCLELGYRDFSHMRTDPDLNNIRYLHRYKKLIRKYKKRNY